MSTNFEYKNILSTSLIILITSSVFFIIIASQINGLGLDRQIISLVFFGLLAKGIYQIYSNLFSSQQRYSEIGILRIISALLFAFFTIIFAYFEIKVSIGLILASIISHAFSAILFVIRSRISLNIPNTKTFKSVTYEYKDYWTMDTLSSLLNTIGRQLPLIIFPMLFGPIIAGYYFFSQRIVAAPVNLIANSVGNVFRKDATNEFNRNGNFYKIFIFSLSRLFLVGIIGVSISLFFIDENILIFLFGDQWSGITSILKLVIIFYTFKFIVSPLTYSLYIVRKLHWNLYGQFFYLTCLFLPILVGYFYNFSPNFIIGMHVGGACIAYLFYLAISFYCAKKGSTL